MEAWNPSHWTAKQFQSPHFLIHGFGFYYGIKRGFSGGASDKELPVNAGEVGDAGSIPGSGRSPGEVNTQDTHSNILAWRIPWTEEPGELYSPWGQKGSDMTDEI